MNRRLLAWTGHRLRLGVHDDFQEAVGRRVGFETEVLLQIAAAERIVLVHDGNAFALASGPNQIFESACLVSIRQYTKSGRSTSNEESVHFNDLYFTFTVFFFMFHSYRIKIK